MAACQRFLETFLSFPGLVEDNLKHLVSEHLNISELSRKMKTHSSLRALQVETQSCYVQLLVVSSHYVTMSLPEERYGVRCRHRSSSPPSLWIASQAPWSVHLARVVAGGLKSFQEKSACLVLSHFRHWDTTKSHMEYNRLLMLCK